MRFSESRFRHPWRAYQARILADFDRHARDGHFHVVAAPGSGKTSLGLEVVRRLDRAALVCAPTVALRAQWVERLSCDFLGGERPAWVSESLDAPGWLTFTTYQGLHAQARARGAAALARALRQAHVRALVLDEAHHLKREWWRTLDAVGRALRDPFVVALTGTPPYDVPQAEWNRYLELAGPIDAEVSVPELVLSGDLCPHQDYVYVQRPTPREEARVTAFHAEVRSLLADLALDRELVRAVLAQPFVRLGVPRTGLTGDAAGEPQIDALLGAPEYALAIAVFLKHADGVVPRVFLEALGVDVRALPPFDAAWAEHLLQGIAFDDADSFGGRAESLRERLQAIGAIERRRVHLRGSPRLERRLRQSPAKLRAVADIVEVESRALGGGLRLLVLSERIRDEPDARVARVGVVPIFDALRRLRLRDVRLCAASGRVGIVPRELAREVERRLGESRAVPLAHDPDYASFALAGDEAAAFVAAVTPAFDAGRLTVLVGTTALLGEGWDAPAVNSLVLATTVGSYVSTNQSRGRALRRDPRQAGKTANVWHPISVDAAGEETSERALLERRFATFMGPAAESPRIEAGLARLALPARLDASAAALCNAATFRRAEDREGMAGLWRRALVPQGARPARPIRETRLPPHASPRAVVRWLPTRALAGRLGRWLARRDARRIARALLAALAEVGAIEAAKAQVHVDGSGDRLGILVDGLSIRDEMVLHDALQQAFCPLFAPRYLLQRYGRIFVVPKRLGENREAADLLRRHVGRARLVYTRTADGRRVLLRAVQRYLARHLHDRPTTGVLWK